MCGGCGRISCCGDVGVRRPSRWRMVTGLPGVASILDFVYFALKGKKQEKKLESKVGHLQVACTKMFSKLL